MRETDRIWGDREGEWHAAKGGFKPEQAAARTIASVYAVPAQLSELTPREEVISVCHIEYIYSS